MRSSFFVIPPTAVIGALIIASLSTGIAFSYSTASAANTYITWDSLEPDKWASIWLIKTHLDTTAVIKVRPTGSSLDGGITFGAPNADYIRSNNQSTFANLLKGYEKVTDPVLNRLGDIITDIETTSWNTAGDPLVNLVEQSFRRLQDRYGNNYVPISCYGSFFDALYEGLSSETNEYELNQSLDQVILDSECTDEPDMAQRPEGKLIAELPIEVLLDEVASNKRVIFVDTREPTEFAKGHIPGALNIPMRDLTPSVYDSLREADRVISYCVKDFRGYEVARLMHKNGVTNVAVMMPHGLAGWKSLGLPITSESKSREVTKNMLHQCAKDRKCIASAY